MRDWEEKETFWNRLQRFLDRVFPERQIHLRTRGRIRFFRIPQWIQVSTTVLAIAFTGWVGYSSFSYIQHDEIVDAKNTMIADARQAYDDLLSDVTAYKHRFSELTRELEDNHNLMLSLVERNATLQRSLSTVEKRLENTESERENVAGAREILRDKLALLENDMQSLSTKNFSLRDNLMSVETDLQTVVRERDEVHTRNTGLQSQVVMLEDRLSGLQAAQDNAVEKMTERTMAYIGSLEKVVEIAGIEVDSKDPRITRLVEDVKAREFEGYAYDGAEASFELLARRALGAVPEFYRVESFRTEVERRFNARGEVTTVSQAVVKMRVGGTHSMQVAEGNGPVNALDDAMRKSLLPAYPELEAMRLVDFKVRILTPQQATAAVTRVMIESSDDTGLRWGTVGISPNIIDAAYEALDDAIVFKLLQKRD